MRQSKWDDRMAILYVHELIFQLLCLLGRFFFPCLHLIRPESYLSTCLHVRRPRRRRRRICPKCVTFDRSCLAVVSASLASLKFLQQNRLVSRYNTATAREGYVNEGRRTNLHHFLGFQQRFPVSCWAESVVCRHKNSFANKCQRKAS